MRIDVAVDLSGCREYRLLEEKSANDKSRRRQKLNEDMIGISNVVLKSSRSLEGRSIHAEKIRRNLDELGNIIALAASVVPRMESNHFEYRHFAADLLGNFEKLEEGAVKINLASQREDMDPASEALPMELIEKWSEAMSSMIEPLGKLREKYESDIHLIHEKGMAEKVLEYSTYLLSAAAVSPRNISTVLNATWNFMIGRLDPASDQIDRANEIYAIEGVVLLAIVTALGAFTYCHSVNDTEKKSDAKFLDKLNAISNSFEEHARRLQRLKNIDTDRRVDSYFENLESIETLFFSSHDVPKFIEKISSLRDEIEAVYLELSTCKTVFGHSKEPGFDGDSFRAYLSFIRSAKGVLSKVSLDYLSCEMNRDWIAETMTRFYAAVRLLKSVASGEGAEWSTSDIYDAFIIFERTLAECSEMMNVIALNEKPSKLQQGTEDAKKYWRFVLPFIVGGWAIATEADDKTISSTAKIITAAGGAILASAAALVALRRWCFGDLSSQKKQISILLKQLESRLSVEVLPYWKHAQYDPSIFSEMVREIESDASVARDEAEQENTLGAFSEMVLQMESETSVTRDKAEQVYKLSSFDRPSCSFWPSDERPRKEGGYSESRSDSAYPDDRENIESLYRGELRVPRSADSRSERSDESSTGGRSIHRGPRNAEPLARDLPHRRRRSSVKPAH